MKAATSNEIKQELKGLTSAKLVDLCLRLARFKKENKELLTFLLFEADDLETYLKNVRDEVDEMFREVNTTSMYFAKKTIRKILRTVNKHIRYTGSKQAEAELLIYFCKKLKELKIFFRKSNVIDKLLDAQVKKIKAAIDSMHEDLQFEYIRALEELQ
ncbi:MAG TPA: hypothetical protein VJ499_07525 [Flavisolibacter sp.]|nr:hypothetical protein [Flavisolibacter sp.]